jgi:sec-independent protein translocase protein TatB
MFGIGPSELVIIGVLFLVIFGPGKLPSMARGVGRLVTESRRHMDELKSELVSEEVKEEVTEARHEVEEVKNELVSGREGGERRRSASL